MSVILEVPDLHCPCTDTNKLKALYDVCSFYKPNVIVQLGDPLDLFSYSRFPHTLNWDTPAQELAEGLRMLKNIWANLQKRAPGAKCLALGGNHTARIEKRILEKCPEMVGFINPEKIMAVDGVEFHADEKEEILINGIVHCHGWLGKIGAHAEFFQKSVVRAHSHGAGIHYISRNGNTIWEMVSGNLVDFSALPLLYRSSKTCRWTHSCGIVDKHGPRIITL